MVVRGWFCVIADTSAPTSWTPPACGRLTAPSTAPPTANFSVAGTGNADGSTLTRLDHSATGDFEGGGALERLTTFAYNRLNQHITRTAGNKDSTGSAMAF